MLTAPSMTARLASRAIVSDEVEGVHPAADMESTAPSTSPKMPSFFAAPTNFRASAVEPKAIEAVEEVTLRPIVEDFAMLSKLGGTVPYENVPARPWFKCLLARQYSFDAYQLS